MTDHIVDHYGNYKKIVRLIEELEDNIDSVLLEPMNPKTLLALKLDISSELTRLAKKYHKQVSDEIDD